MDGTVEGIGIVYKQIHSSHTLDGVRIRSWLLDDQTRCAPVEIVSVLQHVEERTSGLRGFLQDHSHPRAVATGVGAAAIIAEDED